METKIDRAIPFNPENFFGEGWGIKEEDQNSLKLKQINISKIVLSPIFESLKTNIKQKDYIHLDAAIFLIFWKNQDLFLELIEGFEGNIFLLFDGTIICSSGGNLFLMCIYRLDGILRCGHYWLESDCVQNLFCARLGK